jgi:hypothetical protein
MSSIKSTAAGGFEAQGRGERVTGYAQATTWLRRVLVETAAGNLTAPLMSRVFEACSGMLSLVRLAHGRPLRRVGNGCRKIHRRPPVA